MKIQPCPLGVNATQDGRVGFICVLKILHDGEYLETSKNQIKINDEGSIKTNLSLAHKAG